jgi:hypothetical protein
MHRIRAGDLASRYDLRNVEIAALRRCRTNATPSSLQARWIRSAISPRLAIRILSNIPSGA